MNSKRLSWDLENVHLPKVTKMGSIIGHRIDYNGVGAPRGQQHIPKTRQGKTTLYLESYTVLCTPTLSK